MSSTSTAAACTCARRAWVAQVGKGGRAGGGAGGRAEGRSPLCSAEAAEFLWKRRSLAPRQVAGALRTRTPRVGPQHRSGHAPRRTLAHNSMGSWKLASGLASTDFETRRPPSLVNKSASETPGTRSR